MYNNNVENDSEKIDSEHSVHSPSYIKRIYGI